MERERHMTKWEIMEHENHRAVVQFMRDHRMNAYDLHKITRELCSCGSCRFFVQHYTKDGEGLDWGHCDKGNIQHSKKVSTASCAFWEDCDEA